MEFVEITKDGIAGVATVPVTALPHWEGHGWRKVGATDDNPEPTPEPAKATTNVSQPKSSRRVPAASGTTEE